MLRDVCGEKVIIGEGLGAIDFGKLLVLNETAAWLWKEAGQMDDFTIDSLATRLCEHYDVSHETAMSDIADIVAKWREAGVLE